jgi:hypothetical protein
MIEADAPSTGGYVACSYGVPAPPGVVMVSPPEVPRNASRAQSEGPGLSGSVAHEATVCLRVPPRAPKPTERGRLP